MAETSPSESSTLVPGMCEAALSGGMIGPIEGPAKTPRVLVTGKAILLQYFLLYLMCSQNRTNLINRYHINSFHFMASIK